MLNASFFEALQASMTNSCSAVNPKTNPVTVSLPNSNTDGLIFILGQYSQFPRSIVDLLKLARHSLANWKTVQYELDRNVAEEQGSRTDGVSHYELLKKGVLEEYHLDIDSLRPSPPTSAFLETCQDSVSHGSHGFIAGAIYSIEATSTGEILVVRNLANEISERLHGRPLPVDSSLARFLNSHLQEFEPGHEEGLRRSLLPCLDDTQSQEFAKGFQRILQAMDDWWSNLQVDASSPKLQVLSAAS